MNNILKTFAVAGCAAMVVAGPTAATATEHNELWEQLNRIEYCLRDLFENPNDRDPSCLSVIAPSPHGPLDVSPRRLECDRPFKSTLIATILCEVD